MHYTKQYILCNFQEDEDAEEEEEINYDDKVVLRLV